MENEFIDVPRTRRKYVFFPWITIFPRLGIAPTNKHKLVTMHFLMLQSCELDGDQETQLVLESASAARDQLFNSQ